MTYNHSAGKCPFSQANNAGTANRDWWPAQLRLDLLHQHSGQSDPMGTAFDYTKEFNRLDLAAVKRDLTALMTNSQDWWPADFGHYGALFVRMAWHSAGTYRSADGRGGARRGQQRFAPLNSWPDNVNLDKARRLIWPIKQKYGRKISWADLMILTGNVALESMGFKTLGFAGGRMDTWEPDQDVYWGRETTWLAGDLRYAHGKAGVAKADGATTADSKPIGEGAGRTLEHPLAAVQMGLIYVNPEGPDGNPDPLLAARDIRDTFARMDMNDEETVALIAGGHSFGKTHGAAPADHVGVDPEGAGLAAQGLGWQNQFGTGHGADTIGSGLEVTWTKTPVQWSHDFFEHLFAYEWELGKSPAGAHQWYAKNAIASVPHAHDASQKLLPTMLTTDLALRFDPDYEAISRRFLANPEQFSNAFARAWFKLTHRDMGSKARYLGTEIPAEEFLWQDPLPAREHALIDPQDIASIKKMILDSGLTVPQMVSTAWASASTYRGSDLRGGANGARIRLAPQKDWAVNQPEQLNLVLTTLQGIQTRCNATLGAGKQVSIADLIVLAGAAAIEQAAKQAGYTLTVPFTPGRMDAIQSQTDVTSFGVLEPKADAFRNYQATRFAVASEALMVERAQLLTLTAPEMTVLVGGLRVLGANAEQSNLGEFTTRRGTLSHDFFVNLLDMGTTWTPTSIAADIFEGRDRQTGALKWQASRVDLVFGSNAHLRAIAEVYGSADGEEQFISDFIVAWNKVMELDLIKRA